MLKILRTAQVKHILTEKKQTQIFKELQNEKKQIEKELAQLQFQLKKMNKSQGSILHDQSFDQECEKRKQHIQEIKYKIKQIELLPLGTELKGEKVTSIQEVCIGDQWTTSTNELEIIVNDGVVEDIREGRKEE